MRTLLFLTSFFCLTSISFAQLTVSTDTRIDFSWDKESEDWKFESEDEEALSFFEFNKDFTMVKHTTARTTSGYLIKSQVHDKEDDNNRYLFSIVSDVGNKYIMIYDIKFNSIRFVTEDITSMIKYKIKSVWTDE